MTLQRTIKTEPSLRRCTRVGAGVAGVATVGVLLAVLWSSQGPNRVAQTRAGSDSKDQLETVSAGEVTAQPSGNTASHSSVGFSVSALTSESGAQGEPAPETRQLVDRLVRLQPQEGVLTDEFAKGWKENLQRLTQQGAGAIPAIEEFLAKNLDYVFGDAGRQLLGYSSARAAMFDALARIGGPEAVAALTGVLQSTADPREIALLAQNLERLEPQQHQQEVLNVARQALALASSHKLETADPAPLFEVLQKYGGPAMASELAQSANQWNYYATIALAQLPDGAGIPGLVQLAQDPKTTSDTRDAALQMLAQVSDQSPEARAALVAQARQNGISEFAWRILAPVLGGNQVGFVNSAFEHPQGMPQVGGVRTTSTSDNQNFFAMPGNLSTEQAGQRVALMDELLAATSDPKAKELLQQWKGSLSARLSTVVASSGQ